MARIKQQNLYKYLNSYTNLNMLPMTNDSTSTIFTGKDQMKSPRTSTLNYIRQFSRTYAVVAGIALNGMVCN